MEKTIVLLRAVNVGGRKLPMAELRDACRNAGIADIETYIQSGNLVFAAESAATAEATIEALIEACFGMTVEAIARTATQWAIYAAGAPFADADERGNRIHLGIAKGPLASDIAEKLAPRAIFGEEIVIRGDALWIDFKALPDTKLAPPFINKCAGSPVTMRNWRTVLKLAEMAGA